jgi:hypothetical protein
MRDTVRRHSRQAEVEAEQGQALLEFALVAVFLVMIIFGIIDFARLFFAYATMSNGAREGARYAVAHPEPAHDPDIEARTRAMLVVIGSDADVVIERPGSSDGYFGEGCTVPFYCRVRVRVTSDFDVWTPVIPSLNLVAQASMHIETTTE